MQSTGQPFSFSRLTSGPTASSPLLLWLRSEVALGNVALCCVQRLQGQKLGNSIFLHDHPCFTLASWFLQHTGQILPQGRCSCSFPSQLHLHPWSALSFPSGFYSNITVSLRTLFITLFHSTSLFLVFSYALLACKYIQYFAYLCCLWSVSSPVNNSMRTGIFVCFAFCCPEEYSMQS